ncbi:MAG: hypothetical protein V1774_02190 [Candidatus Eisenbacteria bacterium]
MPMTAGAETIPPVDPVPRGDSVAVADSLPPSFAPPGDSTALADSVSPAVPRAAPAALVWWDGTWALRCLPAGASQLLVDRRESPRSSALTFSDLLGEAGGLEVDRAGAHGAWEIPHRLGSGVERLSLWSEGSQLGGVAIPEANPTLVSVLHTGRVDLLAPDPFLDPLGSGGDGLIWTESPIDDWSRSASAVRLTEGPTGAATQELYFGRQAGPWKVFASYGHFSSEGRPFWLSPRYSWMQNQNVVLSLDRAASWSGWRLQVSDRGGRNVLEDNRKLVWQAREIQVLGQIRAAPGLTAQIALGRREDFVIWEDGSESRREGDATHAMVRLSTSRGSWGFLFSGGAETVDLDLNRDPFRIEERDKVGGGVSVGVQQTGAHHAWLLDAGWAAPWWGEDHLRGHGLFTLFPEGRLRFVAEAWSGASAPFVARVDGDPDALLDEGVLLPGGERVSDQPLRRIRHGEGRLEIASGGLRLRAGGFVRDQDHALAVDPDLAEWLVPGVRDAVALAQLEGPLRLTGGCGSFELLLPLRFRIFGAGRLLVEPAADELPPMTARYEGHAGLALGLRAFGGDLFLEGRLIGILRDRLTTPYGELPVYERLDGEIHGTVLGRAHFFIAVRHLVDDEQASVTFVDGEWMSAPFQHTELGIEWHFVD